MERIKIVKYIGMELDEEDKTFLRALRPRSLTMTIQQAGQPAKPARNFNGQYNVASAALDLLGMEFTAS